MRRWASLPAIERAFSIGALGWVVLMLLAVVQWVGDRHVPLGELLRDPEVHVRLLVTVPLLIYARRPISQGIEKCVAQLVKAKFVRADDEQYVRAVATMRSDVRSRFAELTIAALSILLSIANRHQVGPWAFDADGALNWPGFWYALAVVPVHQFLTLRWVYRWIEWDLFVARVSRMPLRLHPTHPDRSAGLSFLCQPAILFGLVAFAASTTLSARFCMLLIRQPGSEPIVAQSIGVYLGLILVLAFAVFLTFVPRLIRLRHEGVHAYGALGQLAATTFAQHWDREDRSGDEFLGSNEPCAMIDYSSVYSIAHTLRIVPVGVAEIAAVLFLTLLPLSALAVVNPKVAHAVGQLARAFI